MAQRIEVLLVDDVDGSEASETLTFGLDGSTYEIDLSEENAAKLRAALADWVDKGRRIKGPAKTAKTTPSKNLPKHDLSKVRAWATANGYEVSSRGRVPRDIAQAYEASLR